jgi:hypothetical protein
LSYHPMDEECRLFSAEFEEIGQSQQRMREIVLLAVPGVLARGGHGATIVGMTTLSVSDRMLRPLTDCFTTEVARRIVDARLDMETQARIDELAAKANHGTLTEEERQEYAEFVEYIDLVGIIKAKARLCLRRHAS